MGLYAYDSDILIDWNDPNRPTKFNARRASKRVSIGALNRKDSDSEKSTFRRGSVAAKKPVKTKSEEKANEDVENPGPRDPNISPNVIVPKYTQAVWLVDEDIVELRHQVNDSFRSLWEIGINAYISGDWQKARDIFQECFILSGKKDGPSKFLIGQIDEHNGSAPMDWPGYRDEGGGH